MFFPLSPSLLPWIKRVPLKNIYLHGSTVISCTDHYSIWQELCCVPLPLILYLSKYTCFHIKRAAVTSWQCVCVCIWDMEASTAKAKQAALIWHDLWLPIISLGVRSWVWLLRTRILNGPSACSQMIPCWPAVDGITKLLDLVQVSILHRQH